MDSSTLIIGILLLFLIIAVFLMYLMNVRIKQLEDELDTVRSRMALTDDELTRLAHYIEDFKRLKI
jgi:Na+-transporting methylmalonyl-CoA/oxaloacetate decarboxylase gamma subunit